MDASKLVVGQTVQMYSGLNDETGKFHSLTYVQSGTVAGITSSCIYVQTQHELLGFDLKGRALTSDKGVFSWEPGVPGTEYGPWYLFDETDDLTPESWKRAL
jgi:hypothetical protein